MSYRCGASGNINSEGRELDERLRQRINGAIRAQLTPRHVPDDIIAVAEVPKTITGKKLEMPLKKILTAVPVRKCCQCRGSQERPLSGVTRDRVDVDSLAAGLDLPDEVTLADAATG